MICHTRQIRIVRPSAINYIFFTIENLNCTVFGSLAHIFIYIYSKYIIIYTVGQSSSSSRTVRRHVLCAHWTQWWRLAGFPHTASCLPSHAIMAHRLEFFDGAYITKADTPQCRGGNPYFFSENPYTSVSFIYASIYRENVHAIHIAMQFANKSRHCVIKVDSQQQRTKIGALP